MLRAQRSASVSRAGSSPPSVSEYREFKDGEIIAGTRYRVMRLIGVGGMGSVYEVEHVELGKRFVLKALLRQLARRHDLVLRLRNEWRALGRLEHPNIVTVTDAGTSSGGVPFYVMERLEGETLAVKMRKARRFPVPEALMVAARVLDGLAAAHQIGVVHRDIKPPNIFMVGSDTPKILDFGVAKIADDPGVVTARGVAIGTPRYMSPEQARGEAVDSRSDIYSTGLILFEMITGVNPFEDARDSKELLVAHLTRSAPRLSALTHGVPAELDSVIEQMLAKDREMRPASARDVAALLSGMRERWNELAKANEKAAVALMPTLSAAPIDDTTRPDGVASRRTTMESSSAGRIAWTRDSDAHDPAIAPTEAAAGAAFEPTAATVRSLSGASGSLVLDITSTPPSSGRPSPATERLSSTPVPPTRTKHPITPTETPSSRKRSGEFRPELTPIPDFRAGNRWLPWTGLGVLALAVGVFALLSRGSGDEQPAPVAAPAPPAVTALATGRSALRPAAEPPARAPAATATAPASPSTEAAAAPAAPSPSASARAARMDGERRARGSRAAKRPPAEPSAEMTPPAPKRPSPAEQALPASGL